MWIARTGIVASSGDAMDIDALAFITAATITDNTQKNAVNQLVKDLKLANVWTKMKAIYPFVGGTASSHKFNLKDPRDLDAAYRLVFSGGWTHSSTGALPNGTTGYADTKFTGSLLQQNSAHISVYLNSDTSGLFCDIGVDDNTGSVSIWSRASNVFYNQINNTLGNYLTTTNTSSYGLYIANRTSSTVLNSWRNSVKLATGSNASSIQTSRVILLAALNDLSGPLYYSNRQQSFASIGDGLSDGEATNLNTAIQTFQVALSRNAPL